MITLRGLGALLTYPRGDLLAALPEVREVISVSMLLERSRKERLVGLIDELSGADPYELEERYVDVFDRGRATSLCLFEHVHGDSRERGQAMVDLKKVYERAGFQLATNELPDYLPAVLEYLSYRTLAEAREMLADCAHIVRAVGERLVSRGSGYAAVFDALLDVAGQAGLDWTAAPAAHAPAARADQSQIEQSHVEQAQEHAQVDEEWMDTPAFGAGPGGSQGQEPGVTPIRYMPRKGRSRGASR